MTEACLWGIDHYEQVGPSFSVKSEERTHYRVDATRRQGATRAERAGLR